MFSSFIKHTTQVGQIILSTYKKYEKVKWFFAVDCELCFSKFLAVGVASTSTDTITGFFILPKAVYPTSKRVTLSLPFGNKSHLHYSWVDTKRKDCKRTKSGQVTGKQRAKRANIKLCLGNPQQTPTVYTVNAGKKTYTKRMHWQWTCVPVDRKNWVQKQNNQKMKQSKNTVNAQFKMYTFSMRN